MGKNNNTKKLKNRLIASDPYAAKRLNNLKLNNEKINKIIATEVSGHYDFSHDLDAFDVAMQISLDKDPGEYFDNLDNIQLDDIKIEGDDIMYLEDEEDKPLTNQDLAALQQEEQYSIWNENYRKQLEEAAGAGKQTDAPKVYQKKRTE